MHRRDMRNGRFIVRIVCPEFSSDVLDVSYVFLKIVVTSRAKHNFKNSSHGKYEGADFFEVFNLHAIGIQDGLYRISSPYRQLLWGLHTVHFDYTL